MFRLRWMWKWKAVGLALVLWGCVTSTTLAQRPVEFAESLAPMILHDAPSILIDKVRLIDGTGAPSRENVSLLITDGRITKIGAAGNAGDSAAVRIDGTGKTLLPGYVMLHEHLMYLNEVADLPAYTSESLTMVPLYLAAGTTTLRTAGTMSASDDLQVKLLIEEGRLAGPDIHATAPYIEGPGSFAFQLKPTETPEQARRFVRYWVSEGATSFKAYRNLSREVLAAAIDEAHKLGATVTGHLCSVTFAEAAALGIDNLEHGPIEASDFIADKEPDRCPPLRNAMQIQANNPELPEARALLQALVEADVAITSTLPVFAAGNHEAIPTPEALDLLSPRSQKAAMDRWLMMLRAPQSAYVTQGREFLAAEMAMERAFVAAGGRLVVGTDPTGWGGTIPPNSTHAALILLVEAGFSPVEAISMATRNGAEFLGIDDDVGTVEVGKRADLILVDGAPDENIEAVSDVTMVFKDGVAWDPQALMDSVRGKVGR